MAATTFALSCASALVAYVAFRSGMAPVPAAIAAVSDHPGRALLCIGLRGGAVAGAMAGTLMACVAMLRARRAL
jgi:hypothetical protein